MLTAGDIVAKLRAEGLLCLTAGDNVLRILPPLIVSEREIDEGDRRSSTRSRGEWPAACRIRRRAKRGARGRAVGREPRGDGAEPGPPRHFLDIDRHETGELRHMLDLGFAYKNGRRDRPLEGKTLAMIFEKPSTRTRVSFEVGDAPARRRRDRARHGRTASSAAARRSPTRRACCRAMSTRS